MTSPQSITSRVYKARGLGGSIIYDGTNVTLCRDTLTSILMGITGISNDYGTQVISAKTITSIEIVQQIGFLKKLIPIYFIRFVYPGSSIINSPSIRSAFAHNTIMMGLFDNRDFFQLREALLADARGDGPPFFGESAVPSASAPLAHSLTHFLGGVASHGLSFITHLKGKLRAMNKSWSAPMLAGATLLIASIGGLALYALQPDYKHLARLGLEVSSAPWSRSVEVSWIGKDAAKYRTHITSAAADMLEAESRIFISQAPSRAAETFRSEFAPRLERIATDARSGIVNYGNWTFDWGTSYWLLVDGVKAAVSEGKNADQKTMVARAESVIRQKITAQYKESLFPEERFEAQMRSGLEKGFSLATSELNRSCQSINDLFESVVNDPVQRLFEGYWITDPTWRDGGIAMPSCAAALAGLRESEVRLQQSTRSAMTETYVPEIAIARLARPLMTVTIGIVGSTTGLTLAAVRFGLPRALLVSPLVTAAGVKLAITVTDLALTSLDEAVNRAQFEAEISSGIAIAQAEVLSASLRDVAETTAAALNMRPQ
ncbi:MAG: hypothetical protein EBY21_00635 [Alphaproteobacteria bacterium]|nr:hypothetical protein [Alphaproteobacteria bacterium]